MRSNSLIHVTFDYLTTAAPTYDVVSFISTIKSILQYGDLSLSPIAAQCKSAHLWTRILYLLLTSICVLALPVAFSYTNHRSSLVHKESLFLNRAAAKYLQSRTYGYIILCSRIGVDFWDFGRVLTANTKVHIITSTTDIHIKRYRKHTLFISIFYVSTFLAHVVYE